MNKYDLKALINYLLCQPCTGDTTEYIAIDSDLFIARYYKNFSGEIVKAIFI